MLMAGSYHIPHSAELQHFKKKVQIRFTTYPRYHKHLHIEWYLMD